MRRISQRELRNDSAAVMRQVVDGASFRVTRRGQDIAELSPISDDAISDLTLRDASGPMEFPPGAVLPESTESVLAELRGDR